MHDTQRLAELADKAQANVNHWRAIVAMNDHRRADAEMRLGQAMLQCAHFQGLLGRSR